MSCSRSPGWVTRGWWVGTAGESGVAHFKARQARNRRHQFERWYRWLGLPGRLRRLRGQLHGYPTHEAVSAGVSRALGSLACLVDGHVLVLGNT